MTAHSKLQIKFIEKKLITTQKRSVYWGIKANVFYGVIRFIIEPLQI